MGRLERKLDLELIERLASGVKHQPKPMKRLKDPRAADSYRGARRNNTPRGKWVGAPRQYEIAETYYRLNRSRKWKEASSYVEARLQVNSVVEIR